MLKLLRCALLSVLALAAAGCTPTPPPPAASPSAAAQLPSTYPSAGAARGEVAGAPFIVRATLAWQDATATWLTFDDTVPLTDGRFDPRAQRPPTTSFLVYLDAARLEPGRYEARDGQVPPHSPIRFAALQQVNEKTREIHIYDTTWTLTMTIDSVLKRESRSDLSGLNLAGTIALRFTTPAASLTGPFVAHDLLRADEVGPNQPTVPAPTSPGRTE